MDAHVGFTVAAALFAGVLVQAVARSVRLPAIVLLFATGTALGPDGLGWVEPRTLGSGLLVVVELAVAVILFEGGLNLQFARLRECSAAIQRLLTLGAVITLGGAALTVHGLLGWGWASSLLFGSLVMVTGPTVIRPMLAELRLRPQLGAVLEAEAVLIDPIGAAIATAALTLVSSQTDSVFVAPLGFLKSLGWGTAVGATGGALLALALSERRILPEGVGNVLVLSSVLLLFELAELLAPSSGLFAVTVAGIAVGNFGRRDLRELAGFKDQISILLIGLLFVLLAADVRLADLHALGWWGAAVVSVLVLVVRPLSVLSSTYGSELTLNERLLAAWMAPRGIVAAAVASVVAFELQKAGEPGAPELRALVFLTISSTVVLAGLTALPVASLLGVRLPARNRTAILGAHALGRLLGAELRSAGRTVEFIDSNPENCRRATEAGFSAVFGNALEERTLEQGQFGNVHTAIGLTPNEEVNGLFVLRAHQLFRVPRGYVALARLREDVTQEFVRHLDVDALFDSAHDVALWTGRLERSEVRLERWRYTAADRANGLQRDLYHGQRFLVLAIQRGAQLSPMPVRQRLRSGDIGLVLLHAPQIEAGRELLAKHGFEREPEQSEVAATA